MRKMHILSSLVVVLLLSASTAFAEVKVTMQDGRVSVVAKDATLRQILTEWARIGQTKIVNVEKVPGGPMTLELANMPEQQALDLLLRSVSGFMTAARPVPVANLSQYDRIVVMPTSAAPRAAMAPQPAAPTFAQPQFTPPPVDDDVEDERPAPNVPMPNVAYPTGAVAYPNGGAVGGVPNPRAPVFNAFPQPQVIAPQVIPPGVNLPTQQQPVQPGAHPTAPFGGVTVPGMIVQPAQQPGQPGQVIQPGQPVRRPGGPQGQ